MGLEIKSVLKNKVSAVIFFILLVLNMVQVPNYMGHEYDVEQNMNIFETQIQQYQRALSDINLQYMAVKHMGAEEKVYWNSYQDYLSWAIDNAKAGWNLFNKYGKEVFKNKGLIKRYNEETQFVMVDQWIRKGEIKIDQLKDLHYGISCIIWML